MREESSGTPVLETGMKNFSPLETSSHRIGYKAWGMVILVPLVFTLITASARYLHSSPFGLQTSVSHSLIWREKSSKGHPHEGDKQPERRQVSNSTVSTSSSAMFPTSISSDLTTTTSVTMTTAPSTPFPTIPSSPPTLPTPFPQPFDSEDLSGNFSSASCQNFFSNMTDGLPFRSCRPLSLLIDRSSAFIDAQKNLTLMNSIIWGTCNTDITQDQCIANMGWFSDALQTACVQDLQDRNQIAVSTLRDLRAYALMRRAGCATNPSNSSYCYLEALEAMGNANIFFYNLPLGLSVPNGTELLCTACTQNLMSTYFSALSNSTEASELTGLQKTYGNAANLAVAQCGTDYADTTVVSAASAALLPGWWTGLAVLICAMLEVLA